MNKKYKTIEQVLADIYDNMIKLKISDKVTNKYKSHQLADEASESKKPSTKQPEVAKQNFRTDAVNMTDAIMTGLGYKIGEKVCHKDDKKCLRPLEIKTFALLRTTRS